jgi:hypothetical protein
MDYAEFYNEMNEHYYRANCYHAIKDPKANATSGNHHVINATYHLISEKLGGYGPGSINKYSDLGQETQFLTSTRIEPGLFNRHPDKVGDQESQDDYIGMEVSGKVLDIIQFGIWSYGEKHHYYYDNLKENKIKLTCWFGRFPGMKAVIKRGAGQPVGVLNRAGFCAAIFWDLIFPTSRTDTSGRILQWLKNRVMKGESKLTDWCILKWEAKIKKDYPGQMGEVLGVYYGYDHPFAMAMWGKL